MAQGFFVPESVIIDETNLRGKTLDSLEFKQFVINLRSIIERHAKAINVRDTGQYTDNESLPGQLFYVTTTADSTPVFRKRVTFGGLPNAGTTSIAHNIPFTAAYTVTRLYGAATDPGATLRGIPIPFVNVSGAEPVGNVELNVDATNVNITTTGNGTNFTRCFVVIEYTKL
jgi:hypothetical protein